MLKLRLLFTALLTIAALSPSYAESVRVGTGVLAADTTPTDVCWGAESSSPTGAMLIGGRAETLDTNIADVGLSVGFTDFTTHTANETNSEDNVAVSDTTRRHSETLDFIVQSAGGTTIIRSAIATAVSGCVRLTPQESGTQFRVTVVAFFGIPAKAFSACTGTSVDTGCDVAHGLGVAPKVGLYAENSTDTTSVVGLPGFGMHTFEASVITQRGFYMRSQEGAAGGAIAAHLFTDRTGALMNDSGTAFNETEVTAVDATNVTLTPRGSAFDADVIGLLLDTDLDVWLDTVDSPNATGEWAVNTPGFEPQALLSVLTWMTAVDTADTTDPGTLSIFATDFATLASVSWMEEDATGGNTNTANRMSSELWMGSDAQAELYAGVTPAATAMGWTIQMDAANGTTHKWIMLAIEAEEANVSVGVTSGPLGGPLQRVVQ